MGSIPKDGSVHVKVKDFFPNHTNKKYIEIGIALDRLRNDRTKSDYENFIPQIKMLTAKSLLEAKELFYLLKQI